MIPLLWIPNGPEHVIIVVSVTGEAASPRPHVSSLHHDAQTHVFMRSQSTQQPLPGTVCVLHRDGTHGHGLFGADQQPGSEACR